MTDQSRELLGYQKQIFELTEELAKAKNDAKPFEKKIQDQQLAYDLLINSQKKL